MCGGSPELTKSVQSFVRTVDRSKQDENPWRRLLRHDAPRALGNTFVACLGAMVLDGRNNLQDSAYLDARKVLLNHVKDCKDMVKLMPIMADSEVSELRQHKGSWETLNSLVQDAGNTLNSRVIAPPSPHCLPCGSPDPTPVPTVPPPTSEDAQLDKALSLTDVHWSLVCDVETYARSPRTAVLRAKAKVLGHEPDSSDEEEVPPLEEDNGSNDLQESGIAKYCEDCEMWLNGPTQWEDHKIGKKHKKNVKKGGANNTTAAQAKAQAKAGAKSKSPPVDTGVASEGLQEVESRKEKLAAAEFFNGLPPYPHPYPMPQWGHYGPPSYGFPAPMYGYGAYQAPFWGDHGFGPSPYAPYGYCMPHVPECNQLPPYHDHAFPSHQ